MFFFYKFWKKWRHDVVQVYQTKTRFWPNQALELQQNELLEKCNPTCTVVANQINRRSGQLVNIIDDNPIIYCMLICHINKNTVSDNCSNIKLLWQQDLGEEPLIFLE